MKKNIFSVFLASTLLSVVMIPSAFALLENNIVVRYISQIFTQGSMSPWVMKFAIFWLVFAIFYALTSKAEFLSTGKGKGVPITISVVLALLASVGMPNAIAQTIFNLYGGLFSAILLLLPFVLMGVIFVKTKDKTPFTHLMMAISLFFLGAILTTQWFQQFIPELIFNALNDPLEIGGIILIILGIMEFVMMFRSWNKNKPDYSTGGSTSTSKGWSNPFKRNKTPEDIAADEAKKIQKEQDKQKQLEAMEKERAEAEELGRFIGSVAADAGRRFETLKDGSVKLHKVLERPDIEKTLPEASTKLVVPLINEAKVMYEDIMKIKGADKNYTALLADIRNGASLALTDEESKLMLIEKTIEDESKLIKEKENWIKIEYPKVAKPKLDKEKKDAEEIIKKAKKNIDEQKADKELSEASIIDLRDILKQIEGKSAPDAEMLRKVDNVIEPQLNASMPNSIPFYLNKINEKITNLAKVSKNPRSLGIYKGELEQVVANFDKGLAILEKSMAGLTLDIDNIAKDMITFRNLQHKLNKLDVEERKIESKSTSSGSLFGTRM